MTTILMKESPFDLLCRDLFRQEPATLAEVHEKFSEMVGASLAADGAPQTKREVKHRLDILAKWFHTLRHDCKWARQRVYEHLPEALRKELEGVTYEPPRMENAAWAVNESPIWTPPR
jgi:hypothetical protein